MLDGLIPFNAPRLPRRVFLYGIHGIGKSTFGACAPKPIFIPTEDGTGDLRKQFPSIGVFPKSSSYGEFMERLWKVATGPHEFETAVVDTADWLETLIKAQVCADGGKESVGDFGYGKGWEKLAKYWDCVMDTLEKCRLRGDNGIGPNMMIIVLAHSEVIRFNDPSTDNYDRYQPALHKSAGPMFMEWADEVLFAKDRVTISKQGEGFKEVTKGQGRGERILFTTARPSHEAKNRLSLPEELPLSFAAYWAAVEAAYAAQDKELPVFGA